MCMMQGNVCRDAAKGVAVLLLSNTSMISIQHDLLKCMPDALRALHYGEEDEDMLDH